MKLEVTIDSTKLRNLKDYVEVKQTENGRVSNYLMQLDDLVDLFSASTKTTMWESPILPKNCIKYSVAPPGLHVYIEIPKGIWEIEYSNKKIKVGFPRLIFQYLLSEKRLTKENGYNVILSKIVAVKGKRRITQTTPLFAFPYSHVNENAQVCMGGTELPDIKCISELESMHSLFFNSPFSSDYGAKTTTGEPLWKLFLEIFNENEFNDEILVPKHDTFNSFFGLGKFEK